VAAAPGGYSPPMGSFLRFLIGRRLARLLPGGWLALLLLSPRSRALAARGWRSLRARQRDSV